MGMIFFFLLSLNLYAGEYAAGPVHERTLAYKNDESIQIFVNQDWDVMHVKKCGTQFDQGQFPQPICLRIAEMKYSQLSRFQESLVADLLKEKQAMEARAGNSLLAA